MLKNTALILQNLQIDYCPGGAMETPRGDLIIAKVNELMTKFDHIIAAIDWHPANHISFAGNHLWRKIGQTMNIDGLDQKLMPFHCVKDSFGAHFYPALQKEKITHTIQQGMETNIDNYSAFHDADKRRNTGLTTYLNSREIKQLFIAGLGIEAGIKNTVLDALVLGYKVVIIKDACDGWEEEAVKKAWKEMEKAGAVIVNLDRVMSIAV